MFDLEDMDGMLRCIVWPEEFAQFGHLVKPDAILLVRGAVDRRPGSEESNLIVNELIPLEELAARYTQGIEIRLQRRRSGPPNGWNGCTKFSAATRASAAWNLC